MENANEAFKLQGQDDSFKDRAYSIFGSLTSSLSSSLKVERPLKIVTKVKMEQKYQKGTEKSILRTETN